MTPETGGLSACIFAHFDADDAYYTHSHAYEE
jgi:hypothetical protein